MNSLTYDQAFQVAALLRKKADDDEAQAAKMDDYANPERKYHPNSVAWAASVQGQLRSDAVAYRAFAKEILERAQ